MHPRRILLLVLTLWAAAQAQLRVQFRDDGITDVQTIHGRVLVVNGTSTAQSELKAEFWLRAPTGRTPQAALWDGTNIDLLMSNMGSGVWKLTMTFHGTLAAGASTNSGNGALVGIHLDDYSSWTKSTCPSWISASTWTNDPSIPLYSSAGALLWGTPPVTIKYDTVSVTAGLHGSASPLGKTAVKDGDSLVVTFTPAATYLINSVTVDGAAQGTPSTWKFTKIAANHTVAVDFVHKDTITVTAGAHGKATPSGTTILKDGDSLSISFLPDTGYRVQSVTVDGVAQGTPTSWKFTNLTSKHSVVVAFEQIPAILRAQFKDEAPTDPQWIRSRVMLVNRTASALSELRADFWMRAPVGRTPQAVLWDGTNIDLLMTPVGSGVWKLSMIFHGTLASGQSTNSGNGASVGIHLDDYSTWTKSTCPSWINSSVWTDDPSIPVYSGSGSLIWGTQPITPKADTITISAGTHGKSVPAGPVYAKDGDSVSLAFAPDTGYRVKSVTIDGVAQGTPTSWKFTNLTSSHAVSIVFEAIPVKLDTVTITSGLHGKASPTGVVSVKDGDSLVVNFIPDSAWQIKSVTIDGVAQGTPTSWKFTKIAAKHTVSVDFVKYDTVVISAGLHGKTTPTGTQILSEGDSLVVSIVPDAGYKILSVLVDGVGQGTPSTWKFSNLTTRHSLSVTFVHSDTIVVASGAHGKALPLGATVLKDGDSLVVSFVPDSGYRVLNVVVDGTSQGRVTSWKFTSVTANHAVSVTFEAAPVPFRVQFKDDSPSDPQWIRARVLPINASGLTKSSLRADFWIKVPAGRTPQASVWDGPGVDFQIVPQPSGLWKVSMIFRNPLVSGQPYNNGNGLLVGLHLDDWSSWSKSGIPSWINTSTWTDDPSLPLYDSLGNLLWGSSPISVPVVPKFDTVVISAGLNGKADPSGTVLVKDGDPLTVNFIPDARYKVKTVTIDGAAQGSPTSWTFDAVGVNHTVAVAFELDVRSQYQVTVDVGPNGRSNVSGAVLVPSGNPLNLRFQPDAGYVVSQVRLDGQPVAVSNSLDLASVQASHSIQVLFTLAPRFTVHLLSGGGGRTDPVGDQLVASGATQTISILPDPGYQIADVKVDGVSKGMVPFVAVDQVQADHSIVASFRLIASGKGSVELKHSEERGTDSMWSKPRIVLSNLGSQAFGPYTYLYYFRTEPSQVPSLSSWSMPQAHGEVQSLGAGNWRLAITSNGALAAGTSENWGNGNFCGLQTVGNPPTKWDLVNDWSWDANTGVPAVDRKIPVYDAQGNLVWGSEPDLRSFGKGAAPNVEALYHDEGGDTNYLRPRILIRNLGDQAFSDFKVVFIFQTEGGKIPVRDDWYLAHPSVSMQSVGNQTYQVVWDYTGVTVGPHSDWPGQPGSIMGLHFPDWSVWDRTNDYSHMVSPNGDLVVDPRILIYDRDGHLVWGDQPKDTSGPRLPLVVQDPLATTANEGDRVTFQVLVAGDGPLSYQWRRNGVDIPGAKAQQYITDSLTMDNDQDAYVCVISNPAGQVVSKPGILTVVPKRVKPRLATCPDSVLLVPQGGSARATVVPGQPDRTSCSWYRVSDGTEASDDCPLLLQHPGTDKTDDRFYAVLSDDWTGDTAKVCPVRAVYQPMAQTNMVISLSGQVALVAGGSKPRDTLVDMVVRMYDVPKDGSPVYLEEHLVSHRQGVPVKDGRFVLEVGRGNSHQDLSETVLAHRSLFVEVGVGDSGFSENFLPRVPLNAVPWELGRTVQGIGEPGARWSSLPVGSLYVDWNTRRTWRKSARGWKPLDQ